jgi:hypothetical protein
MSCGVLTLVAVLNLKLKGRRRQAAPPACQFEAEKNQVQNLRLPGAPTQ